MDAFNRAKAFTTNAHYADLCVAMAVTDRGSGRRKISAFAIEKGTAGIRAGKKENKLGLRASAAGEMIRTDCRQSGRSCWASTAKDLWGQSEGAGRQADLDCGAEYQDGARGV